jgi:hypothetical protein
VKKELEIEERVRLLEKEVNLIGDDIERLRLDLEETVDKLKLEIQAIKMTLRELLPGFEKRHSTIRESVIREIDPEDLQ